MERKTREEEDENSTRNERIRQKKLFPSQIDPTIHASY